MQRWKMYLISLVAFLSLFFPSRSPHAQETPPHTTGKQYVVPVLVSIDDTLKLHYLPRSIQFQLPGIPEGDLRAFSPAVLWPPGASVLQTSLNEPLGLAPISRQFLWVITARVIEGRAEEEGPDVSAFAEETMPFPESAAVSGKFQILPYLYAETGNEDEQAARETAESMRDLCL